MAKNTTLPANDIAASKIARLRVLKLAAGYQWLDPMLFTLHPNNVRTPEEIAAESKILCDRIIASSKAQENDNQPAEIKFLSDPLISYRDGVLWVVRGNCRTYVAQNLLSADERKKLFPKGFWCDVRTNLTLADEIGLIPDQSTFGQNRYTDGQKFRAYQALRQLNYTQFRAAQVAGIPVAGNGQVSTLGKFFDAIRALPRFVEEKYLASQDVSKPEKERPVFGLTQQETLALATEVRNVQTALSTRDEIPDDIRERITSSLEGKRSDAIRAMSQANMLKLAKEIGRTTEVRRIVSLAIAVCSGHAKASALVTAVGPVPDGAKDLPEFDVNGIVQVPSKSRTVKVPVKLAGKSKSKSKSK